MISLSALGRLAAALLLAAQLLACAPLSVGHLARRPWQPGLEGAGESGTVELTFWRFQYTTTVVDDGMAVSGTAFPKANIPAWADYAEELWFAAYLADPRGSVQAWAEAPQRPRLLPAAGGVPFRFIFPSNPGGGAPLELAFGYRMSLVPAAEKDAKARGEARNAFVAYEHAVQRN